MVMDPSGKSNSRINYVSYVSASYSGDILISDIAK